MIRTRWIFTSLLLPALISPAWSQRRRDPLTRLEVDQLRDTAWEPEQRLKLYIKFARARLAAVEQVRSDPKVTDRAQATHDKLQDFLDVYDELNDNIDTYEGRRSRIQLPLARKTQRITNFFSRMRLRPWTPALKIIANCSQSRKRRLSIRGRKSRRR